MANIGDEINGYTFVEELNIGNYCIAYKATKKGGLLSRDKTFFIKEYIDPIRNEKKADVMAKYNAFTRHQDKIIKRLNKLGDNIEKTVDQFNTKFHYFQVKPFISGQDLEKWMKDRSNSNYEKRKQVALLVCEAIRDVHKAGIIHKDLKPGQFMVVKDSSSLGCRLILMDFDWSFIDGECLQVVGTPWYGCLESDKKEITEKSDIFTLGIILCELLAGTGPYSHNHNDVGLTLPTWKNWVSNKRYKQPRDINSNISKAINDVIIKCLDPIPSHRPSLDDIFAALKDTAKPVEKSKCAGICLKNNGAKLLIPMNGKVEKREFKNFFSSVLDDAGRMIYLYFESSTMVLQVGSAGDKVTLSTNIVKNKFTINGKELSGIPMAIKNGDILELFSTSQSKVIAKFTIEFR